jgi:hypothetical protein
MEQGNQERKPYEQPAVVYEAELEVRAGSPVGLPDLLDLTGTTK